MSKPIPQKRPKKSIAVAVPGKSMYDPEPLRVEKARDANRLWIGIDLALNSMAVAGLAYDGVLKQWKGPAFSIVMWKKDDHYFTRLKQASKAYDQISEVICQMRILVDLPQTHITVEEPWPFGMSKLGNSSALKQQAEMSGAMLSGLIRYGYNNIYQINVKKWQAMVAHDLGITTHYSKWGRGLEGKMRSKEWALTWHERENLFPVEIPVWPDLIHDSKNGGNMPKPETSKAKPVQPDDRYDSLAIATYGFLNYGQD